MGRVQTKRIGILLTRDDIKVLDELSGKIGRDWSETVRASVLITAVLLDVGVFDLLKPLPELINILHSRNNPKKNVESKDNKA